MFIYFINFEISKFVWDLWEQVTCNVKLKSAEIFENKLSEVKILIDMQHRFIRTYENE